MSDENEKDVVNDEVREDSIVTREDMFKFYEQTFRDIKEGEIVKGKIIDILSKEILVDIGYKSEGIVSRSEFSHPESLKIGDEVDVLVEAKEDDNGVVVISKWKADSKLGWDRIVNNYQEGSMIEGKVLKKIRGGLIVDVGVEAFLPASLATLGGTNIGQVVGQTLNFKIVKINKMRRNVVISRREVLQKEREESKRTLFDGLNKGEVRKGTVKNITDFGAFIDLGGIDGLLHITDISWGRISHPSEVVAIGDQIDVVVLDFNKESMKVSLGLKQKTPSPWEKVDEKYPLNSKVRGKVVNILPYGAFIELEKGVEGLVHVSELSWTRKVASPNEVLAIGDVVEAVVLSIDKESKKISLGIRQTETNPWLELESKYPVGTKVTGKVRNLTDYGAFVEIEDGIEGLIHISDFCWVKRINHPEEVVKKGERVEVVVLSIDKENRRVSLGLKQLTPDPWPEVIKKFPLDLAIEGKITRIVNFGIFVELEKDIEGLLHISELGMPAEELNTAFKAEDAIKVKVIKLDEQQRRIGLAKNTE